MDVEKLFGSNKEGYENYATEVMKCYDYNPCSVCHKCMTKAWHLYEKCDKCKIVHCHHKQKDRAKLIKPKNFTYNKEDAISKSVDKVYDEYIKNKNK